MSGKLLPTPLSAIFGGTQSRTLELLLSVDVSLGVRDIARQINVSPSTASAALVALNSQGILGRDLVGVSQLYRINGQHILTAHLRKILSAAADIDQKVVDYLRQELKGVRCIIFYGSRARRTADSTSDIDILIIHSSSKNQKYGEELRHVLRNHLTNMIGIQTSITSVLPPTPRDAKTAFWMNIGREGVCLWGDLPAHIRPRKLFAKAKHGTTPRKETRAKSR